MESSTMTIFTTWSRKNGPKSSTFYIRLNLTSRANVDSIHDVLFTKRTTYHDYQIKENLAHTSALWPTERSSGKRAKGVREI